MKKVLWVFAIVFSGISSFSQSGYLVDGLRFSENFYGSTARNIGIAGASSSLGGDLGSISINPAAAGVYRSSEFTFTPTLGVSESKTNFQGSTNEDKNYNFGLDNLGILMNFKSLSGDWEGFSFAFGYNKLNEFNRNYIINKPSSNNVSIADYFISYANGNKPDALNPYWEDLAYQAYVIDSFGNNEYSSEFFRNDLSVKHNYNLKGSLGEYYTAFGANLNNKIYFGLSLNIRSGYYEETFDHTETDLVNNNSFTFSHYINSYYRAFNAKFGVIVRPVESMRFGVSLHTPTVGKVNMDINSKIRSNIYQHFDNQAIGSHTLEPSIADDDEFTVSSPWRFIAGASYLFGQVGLLSFDYEFADYHAMKFSDGKFSDDISSANNDVKTYFKSTHNFRVGGELRFNPIYLRGGFAYYASPYSNATENKNSNTNIYSAGIGYRNSDFFLDFTYSLKTNSSFYQMYNYAGLESTSIKSNIGNYLLTLGFRF